MSNEQKGSSPFPEIPSSVWCPDGQITRPTLGLERFVDPVKLLTRYPGTRKDVLSINSGRLLRLVLLRDSTSIAFSITDFWHGEYNLSFYFDEVKSLIEFSLHTKINPLHMAEFNDSSRHPNLNAKYFKRRVFTYLDQVGLEVQSVRTKWNIGSDNLTVFLEEYRKNGKKASAARMTWAGVTSIENGFTQVEENDVIVEEKNGQIIKVTTVFSKPKSFRQG